MVSRSLPLSELLLPFAHMNTDPRTGFHLPRSQVEGSLHGLHKPARPNEK